MGEMKFVAAIFDVDDTLLDNHAGDVGLHELSRVAAVQEAGEKWCLPALSAHSYEDARQAFITAPVHTLESCLWNTLVMAGVETGDTPDPDNEIFQYVVRRKDELHEAILMKHAAEVPGATRFVRKLGRAGLDDALAIASTAVRRDVLIFLDKMGLKDYFPDERIITKEQFVHAKPNPECFDLAFQRLGLTESKRRRVIAFEDDPRGVLSAKAAGLFTAAITTRHDRVYFEALAVPPDLIAESYAEFEQVLGVPAAAVA